MGPGFWIPQPIEGGGGERNLKNIENENKKQDT